MSNYKTHAFREFEAAGWCDENGKFNDEIQEAICSHVVKLLDVFADEGHSGSTAPYAVNLFRKLAAFKPIVPLTGKDNEWNAIGKEMGRPADRDIYQNKRNSAVFKDGKDGRPYYNNAYLMEWAHDPGNCWNGRIELTDGSSTGRAYIKDFADMPTIKVPIPVTEGVDDPADWEFHPVDRSVLSEVEEHYDLEFFTPEPEE